MKTSILSVSITYLILVAPLAVGAEQLVRLSLKGYPKTARECQASAIAVAQKFGAATGVKIVHTRCERNRALSYDLEIQYVVEKPLDLFTSSAWPIYGGVEQCLENIEFEKEAFTKLTGLTPFLQYCSDYLEVSNGWEKAKHRYTPFFYALGKSKIKSKTFSLHMYEGVTVNPEMIGREIIQKTKSAGLPIVDAFLDLRKGDSELWLKFIMNSSDPDRDYKGMFLLKSHIEARYIPSFLALDVDPMLSGSFKNCEVQREKVQSLFANTFSSPVVWYCMWDSNVFKARLYHLRINPGEESFEKFEPGEDGEPFSNDFTTHAECEMEIPRVVAHYKKKLGDRVTGGLCSWEYKHQSHIRVKMFIYAMAD